MTNRAKHDNQGFVTSYTKNYEAYEAVIEWFWEHHSTYIATAKDFVTNLELPFKIMNKEVDVSLNKGEIQKAEIFQASLQLRQDLASEVARMSGLDMPTPQGEIVSGQPLLVITDTQGKKVDYSLKDYKTTSTELKETVTAMIQEEAQDTLLRV